MATARDEERPRGNKSEERSFLSMKLNHSEEIAIETTLLKSAQYKQHQAISIILPTEYIGCNK
eukprot:scaffold55767_cov36-Cyclotella_meneghiniana.AAC.1